MSLLVTSNQLFGDSLAPIAASTFENRPLTQTELHRHEFYEIVYIAKGALQNELSTDTMDLEEGDLLIMKPFVRHMLQCSPEKPDVLAYCCSFLPSIVDSRLVSLEELQREGSAHRYYFLPFLPLIKDDVSAIRTNIPVAYKEAVVSSMKKLLQHTTGECSEASRARARCSFLELMLTLSDINTEEMSAESVSSSFVPVLGSRYNKGLRKALNYMHENLGDSMTLEEMAQMSGVSVSYFSVMIKQATGMSFLKYLNGLRMDQACHLLRETNENITNICYQLGYNDYSHFSRKFKQVTGTSPRDYRAAQ